MTGLDSKADVGLQCGPRHSVAELGARELRMEIEWGSGAVGQGRVLEAIGPAGNHEACLVRSQIVDFRFQTSRSVEERNLEQVALIHQ